MKVFVGLSGGVDSAVSAALLQQEGYEVTGVFIKIALPGYPCTAAADRLDAMRVAAHLKIPFIEIDLSKEYEQAVFRISLEEFREGKTPNPDALCNREIKFGLFYDFAKSRGAEFIATGHYAQVKTWTSDVQVLVGADAEKDQSYFLWAVDETRLRYTLFPVGHLQKSEVRARAVRFGLPNAERKDSQGLCFLGPVSLDEMLVRELQPAPGDVLFENGDIAGKHQGAVLYTLGQRHGFELYAHTPDTVAHFVIGKDVEKNTITVSPSRFPEGVSKTEITLREMNWIGPAEEGECMARYRYRQKLIPARLDTAKDNVTLLEPHYVPLGQSLVLYRGERCLGGGVVDTIRLCK